MAGKVKPIPDGFHSLTPHLIVKDCPKAIDFYKKAFGAEEIDRCFGEDGKSIMHAELKIGDSMMMLCEEFPHMECFGPEKFGGTPTSIHLYVEDVDAVFDTAVKAGAKVKMPVGDMFWGDRFGKLTDPFGHSWSVATHKEDLTPEEITKRQKEFMAAYATAKK